MVNTQGFIMGINKVKGAGMTLKQTCLVCVGRVGALVVVCVCCVAVLVPVIPILDRWWYLFLSKL